MEEVSALRVSLSLNTAEFSQSIQDVNRRLRAVRSEFTAAGDGTRAFASSMDGLRARTDMLTRQMELHRQKVQTLRRQYEEVAAAQGADSRAAQNLLIRYNNAVGAMNRTEASLRSTQTRLNEVTQAAERNATVWGRMQSRFSGFGQEMQNVGNRMRSVGTTIAQSFGAAAAGVGLALGSSVKKSMDFGAQMSKVGAIAGASGSDLDRLKASALDLGAKTSLSATQVAEAMTEMAAKGYTTNQIIASMPGVISAAEASGEDLSMVADTVSSALNSFGLAANDSSHIADVLARAANDSAAGIEDMQFAFKYAAAPAHALGMSLEDLSSATEIMANAGIKGETAGTTLRAALLRLVKPPKQAREALANLGVSIEDSHGKMLPLSNIIGQLNDKTEGMANAQKTAALAAIFGTEAVSGMLALVNAGPEKIDKLTKSLQDSDGASAKAAAQMKNNLKGALQQLQGSFETMQITIGNALTPAIEKVASAIKSMTDGFNSLSPEMQKFIAIGAAVSGAILAIIAAIGVVVMGVGGVVSAWGTLSMATGTLGGTFAALTGPIGLTVAGLGLAATAAFGIKKAIDASKQANLDYATSLVDQQQSLTKLSSQYSELRDKNKLSNDELLRYRDLQTELKTAKSDEEVKTLTGAMKLLQEKSGLSNNELNKMLGLNDQIIKKTPEVKQSFSDRGNAIISNRSALDEVNARLAENIRLELENQRIKAEANLTTNINNYIAALDQLNAKEKERDDALKARDAAERRLANLKIVAQNQLNAGKDQEAQKTINEIADTQIFLGQQNAKVARIADEVTEKQNSVNKTQQEITKTQQLYDKMINLQLAQVGINAKGSVGIAQLNDAIKKTQTRISRLNEVKNSQGGLNTAQQKELSNLQTALGKYQNTKGEIQKIQGEQQTVNQRIDEGTGKAKGMNTALGKGINKKVSIDDHGGADNLNKKVEKSITKKVTLQAFWTGIKTGLKASILGFASGTNYAPGGFALVGEEGPELMYVPRGSQIINARETKKQLSSNFNSNSTGNANNANGGITQNIVINSPTPTSPSENARKLKQAARQLAMEWR